jgi:hypothetical protein
LALDATLAQMLAVAAGLGVAATIANVWVAVQAGRESVIAGLAA